MANSLPDYTKISTPFANNGDKNTIPQTATNNGLASFDVGFPPITSLPLSEGGQPPTRADFNALGYISTNNIAYLQQGGIYTFDQSISNAIGGYPQGAILAYINNGKLNFLISKIDNNTYDFNSNSSYIGQYWKYANDLSGYLPLTGGTITGNLSVEKELFKTTSMDESSPPTSNTVYNAYKIKTYDGNTMSALDAEYFSSGTLETRVVCAKMVNGTRIYNSIQLQITQNGDRKILWNNIPIDIPAGTVLPFANNTTPTGYLYCNGSAVSRTTYAKLFSAIGTTYGKGDGSTTFNLPDLRGKFVQGANASDAGTVKAAGLPNITASWRGGFSTHRDAWVPTGAVTRDGAKNTYLSDGNADSYIMNFNASLSNAIYGKSSTVQPPAIYMRYCIKY